MTYQPRILESVPGSARFLTFGLAAGADPGPALTKLAADQHDVNVVIGVGLPIAPSVAGLSAFPADLPMFPATQQALWAVLTHDDRGAQLDAGLKLARTLAPSFHLVEEIDAFVYRGGRDLSGFEDGTENPKGDKAFDAAIVDHRGPGLDGGSFVAVQRWVHDLPALERMTPSARDHVVGRHRDGNEEIADAPPSAHVKRTAQESFDPPAFMVRRSMPYGGVAEHGLYFVAYGESLDRFARVLVRMSGRDDGVVDGLMAYTKAVTGGYYFCPPLVDGRLDLRALGR